MLKCTSMAQTIHTTKPPTTTKIITTIIASTTISTSTITYNTRISTSINPTTTYKSSTSQTKESISSTITETVNADLTISIEISTNDSSYPTSTLQYLPNKSFFENNNDAQLFELSALQLEYSKQTNEGSLLAIMMLIALLQMFTMLGIGFTIKVI